jgi:hypothetical protein
MDLSKQELHQPADACHNKTGYTKGTTKVTSTVLLFSKISE